VVQVPNAYMAGNWPLRFASLDAKCENLAVAGRTGFALYSFLTRRWKLFGNESQEKDFVVTGGLIWWGHQLIIGCYNILGDRDEVRLYPRDSPRLDNAHCTTTQVSAQILLLSVMRDHLLVYTADCRINLFDLEQRDTPLASGTVPGLLAIPAVLNKTQEIDVSSLGLHPACLVAATLTTLSTEPYRLTHFREDGQEVRNFCTQLNSPYSFIPCPNEVVKGKVKPQVVHGLMLSNWLMAGRSVVGEYFAERLRSGAVDPAGSHSCTVRHLRGGLPIVLRRSDGAGLLCGDSVGAESGFRLPPQASPDASALVVLRSSRNEGVASALPSRRGQGPHFHVQADNVAISVAHLSAFGSV
jgi:hypothetical protein